MVEGLMGLFWEEGCVVFWRISKVISGIVVFQLIVLGILQVEGWVQGEVVSLD